MDALEARNAARILYGTGNNSNIESPSKVPKEALYPGLTPLVEPANQKQHPRNNNLQHGGGAREAQLIV